MGVGRGRQTGIRSEGRAMAVAAVAVVVCGDAPAAPRETPLCPTSLVGRCAAGPRGVISFNDLSPPTSGRSHYCGPTVIYSQAHNRWKPEPRSPQTGGGGKDVSGGGGGGGGWSASGEGGGGG